MYQQIKELADKAVELQNKDAMDAALREIIGICHRADIGTQELIAKQRELLAAGENLLVSNSNDDSAKPAKKVGAK